VTSVTLDAPSLKCHHDSFDGGFVTRALRNQSLWLIATYVGLLILMARAYA
jgi:hypothetical protein